MHDKLAQQLDTISRNSPDSPPLPQSIVSRTRSIRRRTVITSIAIASTPVIIIVTAATTWIALQNNQPAINQPNDNQIATQNPEQQTIALEDATPANLLRLNQNLDPDNLILPQTYTHISTTPVPTVGSLLKTETLDPPSP